MIHIEREMRSGFRIRGRGGHGRRGETIRSPSLMGLLLLLYILFSFLFLFPLNIAEVPHANMMLRRDGDQEGGALLGVGGGDESHTENTGAMLKQTENLKRRKLDHINITTIIGRT